MMNIDKLKRYDWECDAGMIEMGDGDYVRIDDLEDYVLVEREDLKEFLKYLLCSDVEKNRSEIMDIAQGLLSEQIKSKI